MKYVEEEPLLKPQAQEVDSQYGAQPAEWDQHLLSCCGSGDMQGCSIFSLVWIFPCVAFGHNLKRAFKKSLLLHAAIYFMLFIFSAHLLMGANNMEAAVCPHGPIDDISLAQHLEERPHRKLLHGHHEHDEPPRDGPHGPHPHPPLPTPWEDLTPECQVAIVGKHVVAVWMLLCFFAGVAYCAYRRTQLREKFGIAGSRFGDFCTWLWCGPCALCQETRTLWTNNVGDGVWRGPALPVTCPPQQQFVMSTPAPKQIEN